MINATQIYALTSHADRTYVPRRAIFILIYLITLLSRYVMSKNIKQAPIILFSDEINQQGIH